MAKEEYKEAILPTQLFKLCPKCNEEGTIKICSALNRPIIVFCIFCGSKLAAMENIILFNNDYDANEYLIKYMDNKISTNTE